MDPPIMQTAAFRLYNWVWNLAIPVLRRNDRLADGFEQRTLKQIPEKPAELWIQAASAGEAYLSWELIKRLRPARPIQVLLTTNTRQGIDILHRACSDITPNDRGVTAYSAYFPFDKPSIMRAAVGHIRPRVMVLLETELWPGLLEALKRFGCKRLIINGRITPKSLRRYRAWPSFWRSLRPDAIMAVSKADAQRFAILFNRNQITTMPNMKFDRVGPLVAFSGTKDPLIGIVRPGMPFIVLGSIRSEEETAVAKMIVAILGKVPQAVLGVFPRHLQRLANWKTILHRLSVPWCLRSTVDSPPGPGTVMLWDTFGELSWAYAAAKAAFVGGSLAPLGGQNFLEALICGVAPVIGPHWENFAWVGSEIVAQRLVRQAAGWQQAADILIRDVQSDFERATIRQTALAYIKQRQGGTVRACHTICEYLRG